METTDRIPREPKPVLHINMLTGDLGQRIFCKKKHSLEKVGDLPCFECDNFMGMGQGDTIQCVWEDLPRLSGDTTRIIYPARQTDEYRAVSAYIDEGILREG